MAEWKSYLRVGLVALAVILISQYWGNVMGAAGVVLGALMPLLVGFVVAYIADIPLCFLERQYERVFHGEVALRLRRPLCIVAAVLIVLIVLAVLVVVVIPEFVAAVFVVQAKLPDYVQAVRGWLENTPIGDRIDALIPGGFNGLTNSIRNLDLSEIASTFLAGGAQKAANIIAAATSIVSVVVSVCIGLVLAFTLLLEKETVTKQFVRVMLVWVGEERYGRMLHVVSVLDRSFHGYVVGTGLGAAFQGISVGVIMAILGMPFVLSVAVLVGITTLIPVVGPIVGMVLGVFLVFTESPIQGMMLLVIIFVIQQIWNAAIYPRFVDSSLGLPGIWILAAITVGGVGGIVGMAIAVPVAATAYTLIKERVVAHEAGGRDDAEVQLEAETLVAMKHQLPSEAGAPVTEGQVER